MKKTLVLALAGLFFQADLRGDALTLTADNLEVVIDSSAQPTLRLAADEMTNYLSRVFLKPIPLVHRPTAGVVSLVLGSNEWSNAAGVLPVPAERDSFSYAAAEGRIYLLGRDDASLQAVGSYRAGILQNISRYEMGTLFAVYWFLEEFAGCRFYFPGEYGTIVPRRDSLTLPKESCVRKPDFAVRSVYMLGDGAWPDGSGKSTPSKPKAE